MSCVDLHNIGINNIMVNKNITVSFYNSFVLSVSFFSGIRIARADK